MTTAELLADLQARGVQFRVVDGGVHYHPKSAVSDQIHQQLIDGRDEMLALLIGVQSSATAYEIEIQTSTQNPQNPQNSARRAVADTTGPAPLPLTDMLHNAAADLVAGGDPRRCDLQDDSEAWVQLLTLALAQAEPTTAMDLWGLRLAGLRLVRQGDRWVLRSTIGPGGWKSEADWQADREYGLVPHRTDVERLLSALDREARR